MTAGRTESFGRPSARMLQTRWTNRPTPHRPRRITASGSSPARSGIPVPRAIRWRWTCPDARCRRRPADCDNCHERRLDLHLLDQSPLQGHAQMNEAGLAVVEVSPVSVSAHVLAVDDDPSVRQMIVDYLGDNDIRVTALSSGQQISEILARDTIDLVVLDLKLPGEAGLQKVRAYRFGGWELNVRLRRLTTPKGDAVSLTNTEFNLLAAFLAAPQRVLSRDQLLGLSRLHNDEVYDRSIDTQVGRLRKKIEPSDAKAELIRTERGAGYVFTAAVEIVR